MTAVRLIDGTSEYEVSGNTATQGGLWRTQGRSTESKTRSENAQQPLQIALDKSHENPKHRTVHPSTFRKTTPAENRMISSLRKRITNAGYFQCFQDSYGLTGCPWILIMGYISLKV